MPRPDTSSGARYFEDDSVALEASKELFAELDRDGNGYLSPGELRVAQEVMLRTCTNGAAVTDDLPRLLTCIDGNRDGNVDRDEWEDFSRSLYEVAGRKRYLVMVERWIESLPDLPSKAARPPERLTQRQPATARPSQRRTEQSEDGLDLPAKSARWSHPPSDDQGDDSMGLTVRSFRTTGHRSSVEPHEDSLGLPVRATRTTGHRGLAEQGDDGTPSLTVRATRTHHPHGEDDDGLGRPMATTRSTPSARENAHGGRFSLQIGGAVSSSAKAMGANDQAPKRASVSAWRTPPPPSPQKPVNSARGVGSSPVVQSVAGLVLSGTGKASLDPAVVKAPSMRVATPRGKQAHQQDLPSQGAGRSRTSTSTWYVRPAATSSEPMEPPEHALSVSRCGASAQDGGEACSRQPSFSRPPSSACEEEKATVPDSPSRSGQTQSLQVAGELSLRSSRDVSPSSKSTSMVEATLAADHPHPQVGIEVPGHRHGPASACRGTSSHEATGELAKSVTTEAPDESSTRLASTGSCTTDVGQAMAEVLETRSTSRSFTPDGEIQASEMRMASALVGRNRSESMLSAAFLEAAEHAVAKDRASSKEQAAPKQTRAAPEIPLPGRFPSTSARTSSSLLEAAKTAVLAGTAEEESGVESCSEAAAGTAGAADAGGAAGAVAKAASPAASKQTSGHGGGKASAATPKATATRRSLRNSSVGLVTKPAPSGTRRKAPGGHEASGELGKVGFPPSLSREPSGAPSSVYGVEKGSTEEEEFVYEDEAAKEDAQHNEGTSALTQLKRKAVQKGMLLKDANQKTASELQEWLLDQDGEESVQAEKSLASVTRTQTLTSRRQTAQRLQSKPGKTEPETAPAVASEDADAHGEGGERLHKAAARIQALQRGKMARRQQPKPGKTEPETVPAVASEDADAHGQAPPEGAQDGERLHKMAARIQALQRGKMARRDFDTEKGATLKAASKIQATLRGRKARRDIAHVAQNAALDKAAQQDFSEVALARPEEPRTTVDEAWELMTMQMGFVTNQLRVIDFVNTYRWCKETGLDNKLVQAVPQEIPEELVGTEPLAPDLSAGEVAHLCSALVDDKAISDEDLIFSLSLVQENCRSLEDHVDLALDVDMSFSLALFKRILGLVTFYTHVDQEHILAHLFWAKTGCFELTRRMACVLMEKCFQRKSSHNGSLLDQVVQNSDYLKVCFQGNLVDKNGRTGLRYSDLSLIYSACVRKMPELLQARAKVRVGIRGHKPTTKKQNATPQAWSIPIGIRGVAGRTELSVLFEETFKAMPAGVYRSPLHMVLSMLDSGTSES